jgi:hypothetical protein
VRVARFDDQEHKPLSSAGAEDIEVEAIEHDAKTLPKARPPLMNPEPALDSWLKLLMGYWGVA